MKENEIEMYVKHKAKVLDEVLTYLVVNIAKYRYHNSVNYLSDLKLMHEHSVIDGKNVGNKALKKLWTNFHVDSWLIEFICDGNKKINGKHVRLTKKIVDAAQSMSQYLKYIGKKNVKTKNGKTFNHLSYWMIDTRKAEKAFTNGALTNPKSSFFSRESHAIIDGIVFQYARLRMKMMNECIKNSNNIAGDNTMTKTQKENLKAECEKGLHGLPYEYLVKDIEKREKSNLKRLKTRIRKLTQQAMVEMQIELEKANGRIKELEAENEHLKSLKDLNSDIPQDDDVAEVENKNLDNPFYDMTDEELEATIKSTEAMKKDLAKIEAEKKPVPELVEEVEGVEPKQDDDIPENDIPEDSKVVPRLQEFVNKLYISKREADRLSRLALERRTFKEHPNGWSVEDRYKAKNARHIIFTVFKSEYGKYLEPKDLRWIDDCMR